MADRPWRTLRQRTPDASDDHRHDGDGRRDVCWAVQEEASVSRLHVLWNDGTGKLGDPWVRYLSRTGLRSLAAGCPPCCGGGRASGAD